MAEKSEFTNEASEHDIEKRSSKQDDFGRKCPKNMILKSMVVDIAVSPNSDIVAAGKINGRITVCSFSKDRNKKLFSFKHHKKACRSLVFSNDGKKLFSSSKDDTIQMIDMDTGQVANRISNAHESPIYKMSVVSDNMIASGDESGCVKLWNVGTGQCTAEFTENNDFISDMACDAEQRHLLCTSGDGTLSVFNVKSKKFKQRSDQHDSELLCLAILKNGAKVVCGDGDGSLNIFTWGRWGDMTDRFPAFHESVDAICKVTEDIIIAGCANGSIWSVNIQPNQFLRGIGKYGDLPIERLQLSCDKSLLVSCSHDNRVKFWDVTDIDQQMPITEKKKKTAKRKRKANDFIPEKTQNFFDDL